MYPWGNRTDNPFFEHVAFAEALVIQQLIEYSCKYFFVSCHVAFSYINVARFIKLYLHHNNNNNNMTQNKTLFIEYFGDSPTTRVLDFFVENDLYDYSKTDIFRETGVARTTLQGVIKKLLKKKIIVKMRMVGRAAMYKLNRGNPIVEEIVRFAINVVTSAVKAEVAQEITA